MDCAIVVDCACSEANVSRSSAICSSSGTLLQNVPESADWSDASVSSTSRRSREREERETGQFAGEESTQMVSVEEWIDASDGAAAPLDKEASVVKVCWSVSRSDCSSVSITACHVGPHAYKHGRRSCDRRLGRSLPPSDTDPSPQNTGSRRDSFLHPLLINRTKHTYEDRTTLEWKEKCEMG